MNTIYHWVGLFVFWAVVLGASVFGLGFLWQEAAWFKPYRRRISNAWLGFKIVVLRRPFVRGRSVCRLIIQLSARGAGYWASDWWERNLAARIIRDSRRAGFPVED